MQALRTRRLALVADLEDAIRGVRYLFPEDRPGGVDWHQLVSDMRQAAAVLRSAEDDNEQR